MQWRLKLSNGDWRFQWQIQRIHLLNLDDLNFLLGYGEFLAITS